MNRKYELSSMKICEYFNDIGLIDHNNVNIFLNIFSEISRKKNAKNKNDILINSLFTFMTFISKNEKLLYEYSKRTINAFNNNKLISKYKSIKIIKTVFYLNLKNILTNFLFNLIRSKENIKKRNLTRNKNLNKLKSPKINNTEEVKKDSLKNSINIIQNYSLNDEKECTFIPKINKNFKPYYDKKPVKSYSYYGGFNEIYNQFQKKKQPINLNYQNQNKIYKSKTKQNRQYNSVNNSNNYNFSPKPEINIKNNNYDTIIYNNSYNNSSIDSTKYNFLINEVNHINRVNDKILNLKMKKVNDIEKDCTFYPKTNKNYKKKEEDTKPRYIILHNDAKIRKNNFNQLKNKYLNIEDNNFNYKENKVSNSNYYKKLYNDAFYYKEREIENERKEYEKYSFSPKFFKNDKYLINIPFSERRAKSIEAKKNLLKKKEDEEKKELEEMKKNSVNKNKNIDSKQIINRLYFKEYAKIKERIEKEKKEKEEKNKKKQIINWDKVNNENNIKYLDNKKKENLKKEEPIKVISNNGEKEIKIENINQKNIEKPLSLNLNINEEEINQNKLIEKELLMEKIKKEKNKDNNDINNKNISEGNTSEIKKYIEIQSLSSDKK